jgi:hypothetical protein
MSTAVTNSIRFAKFITVDQEASVIIANVRFITNKKHAQYGMCHIFTDGPNSVLSGHSLYNSLFMTEKDTRKVLADNGFVEVCSDFNAHNIDHLVMVREFLPDDWIECFNNWSKKIKS